MIAMQRRHFLMGAASLACCRPAAGADTVLKAAARDACIYVSPLVEIAAVRGALLSRQAKVGQFYSRGTLASPSSRQITTPNNDTLNAEAFVDLSHGPAGLRFPPLGGRYASVAVMDMYSNNVVVLDTRNVGAAGGDFVLAGPGTRGPQDSTRVPTPWAWLIVRVLVDGPHDLDAAKTALGHFGIDAPESNRAAPAAERTAPWSRYFSAASGLLRENPPPSADQAMLARIAPLGLADGRFDAERFKDADVAEIAAGLAEARETLRTSAGLGRQIVGGWAYEDPRTGNFGQDYLTRARVALGGLGALPVTEAM
jgi:hypothetical protein